MTEQLENSYQPRKPLEDTEHTSIIVAIWRLHATVDTGGHLVWVLRVRCRITWLRLCLGAIVRHLGAGLDISSGICLITVVIISTGSNVWMILACGIARRAHYGPRGVRGIPRGRRLGRLVRRVCVSIATRRSIALLVGIGARGTSVSRGASSRVPGSNGRGLACTSVVPVDLRWAMVLARHMDFGHAILS